jgi:putative two-component system response regulator
MDSVPAQILVVDDQPDNLLILEDLLDGDYRVHTATDGRQAWEYLAGGAGADLILLDVVMPGMDGFEVCRRVKSDPRLGDVPVLFLTSLESAADEELGLSLGASDFIHKPFSPPVVLARVRNHLQLAQAGRLLRDRNQELERLVAERTRELLRQSAALLQREQELAASQGAIIAALCSLAEVRDNETGNHIHRTQHYVQSLALELHEHPRYRDALDEDTILLLFRSAPLHDVGKVAIPDAILLKPGPLTAEEWEIMKLHTVHGRDAIAQAEGELNESHRGFLRHAREIAYSHHEKWDGSGYPQGLSGDAIPLSARLMAVADVYDALISRRVYKAPYSHDEAIAMMTRERGRHFDPDVLDALLAIEGEFHTIAQRYSDPQR